MWVMHKYKKRSQVLPQEQLFWLKVCFESLSQHQSKNVTEAVPRHALWKASKPLKSERTFIVKQSTVKQNHFQRLGKVVYSK